MTYDEEDAKDGLVEVDAKDVRVGDLILRHRFGGGLWQGRTNGGSGYLVQSVVKPGSWEGVNPKRPNSVHPFSVVGLVRVKRPSEPKILTGPIEPKKEWTPPSGDPKFPSFCPVCGGVAYVSALSVEHRPGSETKCSAR